MVVWIETGREFRGRERAKRRKIAARLSGRQGAKKAFCVGFYGTKRLSLSLDTRRVTTTQINIRRLGPRREPVPRRPLLINKDDVDVPARARVPPDARLDGTTHGLDHKFRRRLRLSP